MQDILERARLQGLIFEFPELNPSKRLRELVLYISAECEDEPSFGATMLNKILLFADIAAFVEYGKSISGTSYVKRQHGPVPSRIHRIIEKMVDDDEVSIHVVDRFGLKQKRIVPRINPDLSAFTRTDISIVRQAIDTFSKFSASEVSEMTHERAWKCASLGKKIPYQAFLLSSKPMTSDDKKWAASMVSIYGQDWPDSQEH